jgi:hypothetical protein
VTNDVERKAVLRVAAGVLCLLAAGCQGRQAAADPAVAFTKLPPAGEGSPDKLYAIEGRATAVQPGQRIVLFARSGLWWVQPTADHPFTDIQADSSWKSFTHPGSAYAALLVKAGYSPPSTITALPNAGGAIVAVARAEGPSLARADVQSIQFSGYEWEIRQDASNRGGTRNVYDPSNVWIDEKGFLHLRIAGKQNEWSSAEVRLTRSLGYGSYRFVVRDVSQLEPAAVFSIFTWDEAGPPREVDIEVSRWGETASKNAQYVIQPYYVPANVIRFLAPAGTLSLSFRWQPGRVSFKTARGAGSGAGANVVAEHAFTSGVPSPGSEAVHMNLYVYANKSNPLRHGAEVIVEEFEYLP